MNPLSKYMTLVTVMALALFSCKKILSDDQRNPSGSQYGGWVPKAPVAIAFYDSLSNQPVGTKFLTGKYSTDDGTITSWKWKQLYGPSTANIARPDSMETTVSNLYNGNYSFELGIEDNHGVSAKATVLVTVVDGLTGDNPNRQTVDAGVDQTITLPLDSVYLDASSSTPNGQTAQQATLFYWTMISGPTQYSLTRVTNLGPELSRTTVRASNLVPGVYSFELTIAVTGAALITDTMQVTVLDDPQNKNTLTYHNLIWKKSGTPPASWSTTFLPTPLRPDLWDAAGVHKRNLEISRRPDPQSPWIAVPFSIDRTAPYVWYGLPYTGIIRTQPDNPALVGTRSDMRIKIL